MAVTTFVPQVWGAAVLAALDEELVYASPIATNRDYEGEVSEYGGSVVVNTVADLTIQDYVPYTDMATGQGTTSQLVMDINQRKAWSVALDDVDRAQVRDDVDLVGKISKRAAHQLSKAADTYVAGLMLAATTPGAEIASVDTPDEAWNVLIDLRTQLSDNHVPTDGRFVVVTPKFAGLLLKDQRFIASGDAAAAATRANGIIGRAAGFAVKESALVPDGPGAGAGKAIIAGHPIATTFANQISKVEAVRNPKQFSDTIRGLSLYGAKVVRPTALASRDVVVV